MSEKKAVFFCSASKDIDPKYNQAAREAVRAACLAGYSIVSGGSFRGTMGVVCDTARECGAPNCGVLPEFMKGLEYDGLTELRWSRSMSERKEMMREGVSLVVALPGGIGTMDELFETFTLAKLGQFHGKLAVLNIGGFYDPLEALLDHFVAANMLTPEDRKILHICSTTNEIEALL